MLKNYYQLSQTGQETQSILDHMECGKTLYLSVAPGANNPDYPGKLQIVILNDVPQTKYDGYWYIIISSGSSSGRQIKFGDLLVDQMYINDMPITEVYWGMNQII